MKPTKARLIAVGAELFLLHSYQGTGINDILKACGVPKGSFYNYFPSKEDFALEVIDYHIERAEEFVKENLCNNRLSPLNRIAAYWDAITEGMIAYNFAAGCPFGTLAQEVAYLSPKLRVALARAFQIQVIRMANCIELGQQQGEIKPELNAREMSDFIYCAFEGAQILAKTYLDAGPLVQAQRMLIDYILPANPVPRPSPPTFRSD